MCRELHGLAKVARAERILLQFCILAPRGPLPELPPHLLCQDRRVPEDLLHGQSIMTDPPSTNRPVKRLPDFCCILEL